MRLKKYLTEGKDMTVKDAWEIMDIIKRDCQSFLRSRRKKQFLWRGSSQTIEYFEKLTPRTDRTPRDMPLDWHKGIDEALEAKFGWKPRSQGVFCYGSHVRTEYYGEPFLMFPIGRFRYVWSPEVTDLYIKTFSFIHAKKLSFEDIAEKYIDTDLKHAIEKGNNEIIINCKEYYLVDESFVYPSDADKDYFKDLGDL